MVAVRAEVCRPAGNWAIVITPIEIVLWAEALANGRGEFVTEIRHGGAIKITRRRKEGQRA